MKYDPLNNQLKEFGVQSIYYWNIVSRVVVPQSDIRRATVFRNINHTVDF